MNAPPPRIPPTGRSAGRPRGLSVVELIVVLGVVGFFGLCVLVALPRGRESARMAGCQRNLMQIGVALQLYEQANRHYPISPPLDGPLAGDSPVRAMLDALTLPDFLNLRDRSAPPKPGQAAVPGTRVAGLVCPSDPQAQGGSLAGLSYRGNAGDRTDGTTGPFAPQVRFGLARVEAADGASFTAGFAERLLGNGRDEPDPANYQIGDGPVVGPCPDDPPSAGRWRGDAGASWAEPGWRSALYTHAQGPNAPATCLARDGRTANVTASSAHRDQINVGMLDGSLKVIKPTIDAAVWRALGSVGPAPAADGSAP